MKKIRVAKRLISEYLSVVKERKSLEEKEKELKTAIISLMEGDTEEVDSYIVKNSVVESMRMDSKKARKELGNDVYISLCNKVISRRFTISV